MAAPPASTPFGIAPYVGRAVERIRVHFRAGLAAEAFVIGVFGEWGSGKSTVLNAIGGSFSNSEPPVDGSVTLRVDFNAWRFEREEHLLIPLLKTIERTLELYIEQLRAGTAVPAEPLAPPSRWQRFLPRSQSKAFASEIDPAGEEHGWRWLKERAVLLANCTIALSSAFKLKVDVPGLGELEVAPGEAQEAVQRQLERGETRAAAARAETRRKLESLYYDLYAHLRRVTRGDRPDEKRQLNFVFLIDDLDRCLPEKAVEMLEAIKLFLDVEGCAFVLALDDEVIERGIAHRYRDYLRPPEYLVMAQNGRVAAEGGERRDDTATPPITGHEYLEKIVQLPFRLPRWTKGEVREFVQSRFADFLARWAGAPTDTLAVASPPATADPWLLDLVVAAVPPIPRNIVRAIELLEFTRAVAIDRKLGERLQAYTLAQLVLLQLFAPQCFRFLRRGNADGWKTFEKRLLRDHGEFTDTFVVDKLKVQPPIFSEAFFDWWAELCDLRTKDSQTADPYVDRTERPLIHQLRAARANRGGFDPRNLVLFGRETVRVDELLEPYFSLFADGAAQGTLGATTPPLRFDGSGTTTVAPAAAAPAAPAPSPAMPAGFTAPPAAAAQVATPSPVPSAALTGAPRDREEFVRQLLSPSPEAWRNAISREDSLRGRTLDERTFMELVNRLENDTVARDVLWLETVAPLLTAGQMRILLRKSHLLRRLAVKAGVVEASLGAA